MSQMQQADRLSIPVFMGRDMNDVCVFPTYTCIYFEKEVFYKPWSIQYFFFHWYF